MKKRDYMKVKYYFPFGQELKKVEQIDKSPKKVFVLGVYASAVHAKWIGKNGKQKVAALAVASEPEIFWCGGNAEEIINKIKIPKELGKLTVPANSKFNGPSGITLDEMFLKPLDLSRDDAWLCDLLPYSRVNDNQHKAISKHYTDEIIKRFNLKHATIPHFDKKELKSKNRPQEILNEIIKSKADTIILLGDLPIKYFLKNFEKKYSKLSQFGETRDSYGQIHKIKIDNKMYNVIPLCHPRQANRLGRSSTKWGMLHDNWIKNGAVKLF